MPRLARRPTPAVENYLGAMYIMERDGERVIGRKLADWLGVSAPTVSVTVRRMVAHGWATVDDDKTIWLTDAGRAAAISVVKRHMLVELLLARILGVPWSQVHEEADRIEHDLSAETAARVAQVVDGTRVCPHGNPFPGQEDATANLVPLLEAPLGAPRVLARVHEEIERSRERMAFLERMGLVPGCDITLEEVTPANNTVTVRSGRESIVLGTALASGLWVAHAEASVD